MENIKLAIITEDKEYGRALSLSIVDVYKNFTVTLFQSAPLHTQLDHFDLVLTDDQEEDTGERIYLVEKPSMVDMDYERNVFRLYKYSNVRQLAGELLFIYTSITGRKALPIKNQDLKLIAFGAVEGGVGCTAAAMAFAQELKRFRGKRVIYISLEELESTLEYMEPFPQGKSISEYLYHLFHEDSTERLPFIESFLVFDYYGVDAFLPSPGRNLLKSLTAEEMQYFIGAVMDTGRYDFLILDIGCALDKSALSCYEMANNICMVSRDGSGSYKEERFVEYLTFLRGEAVIERMAKIVNWHTPLQQQSDELAEEGQDELLRTVCRIPEDKASFSTHNGIKAICSDGVYGKGIRELADSILNNRLLA